MADFNTQYGNFSDPAMVNAASQWANSQADAAYKQALASGASSDQALNAAKFAWQQKMDTAYQTGQWNGQWSNPQEQWFTGQFGQWYGPGGAPQAGDQTLAAQQQGFGQSNALGGLYGQYYAPGTAPTEGTATQAAGTAAAAQAATRAGMTGYLQNTGTGNIQSDAWNLLDQPTQQDYINQHGGVQQAQQAYFANLQNSVRDSYASSGKAFTPQAMSDYVYGGVGGAGGAGGQGTETMQHQQQMFTQGLQTEQEARAAQAQQQSQTQAYLSLLSSLRGPADWAKYQQVLGSTPNGMRDLAAAAMGQYVPGGGATTGQQPQAASLQSLMGQISGQPYYGQGGGQLQQPNVYQGGQGSYGQPQQAQPGGYQYRQGDPQYGQSAGAGQYLGTQTYPGQQQTDVMTRQPDAAYGQLGTPGVQFGGQRMGQTQGQNSQAWGSGLNIGTQQMTPQQAQQAQGNGTNMYGAQQNQYNLPAPNQIASQSWKNMAPSQQQMLLGQYESQGWDKGDVQALMNQALPKYGTNSASAGTWRMQ